MQLIHIFITSSLSNYIQSISYLDVTIHILRLDLIHPDLQGNKYYKLKYNIDYALQKQKKVLLSFGGEYSNHIHALALAGKKYNLKTIGIIRGDQETKRTNTLCEVENMGMDIYFVNRTTYRNLRILMHEGNEKAVYELLCQNGLKNEMEDIYFIPEGGTNLLALKGTQEILNETNVNYSTICVSVGSAGTIAGLIASKKEEVKIIGFPALKGNFFESEIQYLLNLIENQNASNWTLQNAYHFGGFGAYNMKLVDFANQFYADYSIPLDMVYTAKMFYGIFDLIEKNYFKKSDIILAIHTGGLQGIAGFNEKNGALINY